MAPFDSYKDLLIYACTLIQPETVLEYGPGGSTAFFLEYSDAVIHSIEHDSNWLQRAESEFAGSKRVNFHLIQDRKRYSKEDFGLKYDIVFVDGLCGWRTDCLMRAPEKLTPEGYVILHDSERWHYDEGKALYDEILTINGTTMYAPKNRKEKSIDL
jgi:predicted O-methyltransferase YrrM